MDFHDTIEWLVWLPTICFLSLPFERKMVWSEVWSDTWRNIEQYRTGLWYGVTQFKAGVHKTGKKDDTPTQTFFLLSFKIRYTILFSCQDDSVMMWCQMMMCLIDGVNDSFYFYNGIGNIFCKLTPQLSRTVRRVILLAKARESESWCFKNQAHNFASPSKRTMVDAILRKDWRKRKKIANSCLLDVGVWVVMVLFGNSIDIAISLVSINMNVLCSHFDRLLLSPSATSYLPHRLQNSDGFSPFQVLRHLRSEHAGRNSWAVKNRTSCFHGGLLLNLFKAAACSVVWNIVVHATFA